MGTELVSKWVEKSISDFARVEIGGTPARKEPTYWDPLKVTQNRWVAISDLKGKFITDTKEYISDIGVSNSNVKPVEPGTVLMSFKLTLGRTAIAKVPLFTNEAIAAFYPDKSAEPEFLYYALPEAALGSAADVAVKGKTLNKKKLNAMHLLLPPLPEQRKIAAILSSVDEAIEKTQAVIDQVQVVKKGLMQELLTRGIPGRHTRFKQTEIGEIPEEWKVIRIGDCGSWSSGGTPSKRKPQYWNGDVPWVSPKDMKRLRITDAIDHVTEAAIGNGTRLVPESTLLMVVRGMILAHSFPVAITGSAVTFNQDMKALNVDDRFDPEFVLRCLRHRESWFVERVSTSSHGTKRLTSDTLFDALLPVPTRDEQERIAASASALDEYVDSLRSESMSLTALKTGLMSVLLTGEVRVKVDEQDDQDGVAA